jgi:hypothetical protein
VLPNYVNISLHPEYTKIEKVNELAKFLLDNDVELQFNLSCDPFHWEETKSLYEDLDDDLKVYAIPKVLIDHGSTLDTYDYTAEQRQWILAQQAHHDNNKPLPKLTSVLTIPLMVFDDGSIKKMTNFAELTINDQHKFKGWLCSAGSSSIHAGSDGRVWSSICKIVSLGRLETFDLLTQPVICNKNYCIRPGDMLLSKRKN